MTTEVDFLCQIAEGGVGCSVTAEVEYLYLIANGGVQRDC